MKHEEIALTHGNAKGYEISLGPVNLVLAVAENGIVGCGALDIPALDKFNVAAARVSGVKTVADLLKAKVNLVNEAGAAAGLTTDMTGSQALEKLAQ